MSQNPFLPVPVNPRSDGWTPERQWRFVEALAATASVTQSARVVGMTARSAQRLRRHPEATAFRAAWDAALAQVWGQLEQVVLDRAINGEREMIERDGFLVGERRRPCSERLIIHLLNSRDRALAAARADRAEAHQRAMAEARLAAILAANAAPRRKRAMAATPPAPAPVPELIDDAAAETTALAAFQAHAATFGDWPAMDDAGDFHITPPPPPLAAAMMAAAEAAEIVRAARATAAAIGDAGAAGDAGASEDEDVEEELAAKRQAAVEARQAAEYESRPRWEDYRIPGQDGWADTPDASRRL